MKSEGQPPKFTHEALRILEADAGEHFRKSDLAHELEQQGFPTGMANVLEIVGWLLTHGHVSAVPGVQQELYILNADRPAPPG